MTYEEAKEQVAKNHGFIDWKDVLFHAVNFQGVDGIRHESFYYQEAALLYGEAKWNEACEEQTNELNKLFDKSGGTLSGYYTQLNLIKPPFKP